MFWGKKAAIDINAGWNGLAEFLEMHGYEPQVYREANSTYVVLKIKLTRAERAIDRCFEELTWAK